MFLVFSLEHLGDVSLALWPEFLSVVFHFFFRLHTLSNILSHIILKRSGIYFTPEFSCSSSASLRERISFSRWDERLPHFMLHGTFHESAWPRGEHSGKRQDLDIMKANILQSNDGKSCSKRIRKENIIFGQARSTRVEMQGE